MNLNTLDGLTNSGEVVELKTTPKPLFTPDMHVQDVKSGDVYIIDQTPANVRVLVAGKAIPAYIYHEAQGPSFVLIRPQEDMEATFEETEIYECVMHGINAGSDCPKC